MMVIISMAILGALCVICTVIMHRQYDWAKNAHSFIKATVWTLLCHFMRTQIVQTFSVEVCNYSPDMIFASKSWILDISIPKSRPGSHSIRIPLKDFHRITEDSLMPICQYAHWAFHKPFATHNSCWWKYPSIRLPKSSAETNSNWRIVRRLKGGMLLHVLYKFNLNFVELNNQITFLAMRV